MGASMLFHRKAKRSADDETQPVPENAHQPQHQPHRNPASRVGRRRCSSRSPGRRGRCCRSARRTATMAAVAVPPGQPRTVPRRRFASRRPPTTRTDRNPAARHRHIPATIFRRRTGERRRVCQHRQATDKRRRRAPSLATVVAFREPLAPSHARAEKRAASRPRLDMAAVAGPSLTQIQVAAFCRQR